MNNKISQINVLKSISALAVFLIHYIGIYLNAFSGPAHLTFIRNMCHFSVPVFYIISGYLHAGKNYSYKKVFKRLLYFYLLTVFTNFICAVLNTYIRNHDQSITILSILSDSFLLKLIPHSHLFFMINLMILYLFVPIFSVASEEKIIIFTIITTVFSVFKPKIFSFFELPFPLPYYFSYFLIGYSMKYISAFKKKLILIISLVLFVVIFMEEKGKTVYNYDDLSIFFLSIFVFILFLFINIKNNTILNLFENISIASFGVYLTHPILIHFIFTYLKLNLKGFIFWLVFFISFSINVIGILILKKIFSQLRQIFRFLPKI